MAGPVPGRPGRRPGHPERLPDVDVGHDIAVAPLLAASAPVFPTLAAVPAAARAGCPGGDSGRGRRRAWRSGASAAARTAWGASPWTGRAAARAAASLAAPRVSLLWQPYERTTDDQPAPAAR